MSAKIDKEWLNGLDPTGPTLLP